MPQDNPNSLANLKPPFSKDNQPKKRGARKPSSIKKYIKDNNMSYADVSLMSKYILGLTQEQLKDLLTNEKAAFLVRLYAHAVMKDMKNGNLSNVMQIVDRAVGKLKDTIEISGKDGGPIYTKDERTIRIQQLIDKRNADDPN